jgi:chromosome segregation ATPase
LFVKTPLIIRQLYTQVQERDQQLLSLNDQVLQLRNSLTTTEKQLLDAFNEQVRMEEEICSHQTVTEKLREQLKEAEKERREVNRRYHEQVRLNAKIPQKDSNFLGQII